MGPTDQLCPMELMRLSEPPAERLWQELQLITPDFDKRGSKNNFFPKSTFAVLVILAGSIGCMGSFAYVGKVVMAVNVSRDSAFLIMEIPWLNLLLKAYSSKK